MQNPYLLLLALLGWALSLYFGFFRYRQFQWTRHKVQYDLFTRINQRSDQLFLRVTTLAVLQKKNNKLSVKFRGVLHKYLEGWQEKVLIIQSGTVSHEMAEFWVNGTLNELSLLHEQQPGLIDQLTQSVGEGVAGLAMIDAHRQLVANPQADQQIKTKLVAQLSATTPNSTSA